jgi:N-acyl-L-homoserine lactone synthetase
MVIRLCIKGYDDIVKSFNLFYCLTASCYILTQNYSSLYFSYPPPSTLIFISKTRFPPKINSKFSEKSPIFKNFLLFRLCLAGINEEIYRILIVTRARAAKATARSQKRMTICGSLQPIS